MIFWSLLQLMGTMLQRAFGKQVNYLPATISSPIDRQVTVDKSKNLYPIQFSNLVSITTNHPHRLLLTLRNTS